MTRKLNIDKNGNLVENAAEKLEHHSYTTNEWRTVNGIRGGCISAIETILADYNPLQGLPELNVPCKARMSYKVQMAKYQTKDVKVEETFTGISEFIENEEKKYNEAFKEYSSELKRRQKILSSYEFTVDRITDSINYGLYKDALIKARKELKGSYKDEVCAAIIRAAHQEAPILNRAIERHHKYDARNNAIKKIADGISDLFNL